MISQGRSASASTMSTYDDNATNQRVFELARKYIKPPWTFRIATYLVAERKLFIVFLIHFVCTLVVWVHFALVKFQEQEEKVPTAANYYWFKRLAPPIEFGSMHAILFQMSLLPLTMSRLSVATASSSFLDTFIPFNRMMRLHIHLGYTMVAFVSFATIFFFVFFGVLCSAGEEAFCAKFTDEIMITGYCLVGILLIVGVTSYLRYSMKYQAFYSLHHLVFVIFALSIAHTLDIAERTDEKDRSQTWKFFSATLLYYILDRSAMAANHSYRSFVAASSAVTSSKGTRMVIIKVHRPALFHFKPGQYCLLRIPSIDAIFWHPFSLASCPDADHLEFYMEVYGETSWTNTLWKMSNARNEEGANTYSGQQNMHAQIGVEVKGPYGASLGTPEDYSHALAIGSGSGIVPILSLLRQHIRQVMRFEPNAFFREQDLYDQKIRHLYAEQKRRGPLVRCGRRTSRGRKAAHNKHSLSRVVGNETNAGRGQSEITARIASLSSIKARPQRQRSLKEIRRKSTNARQKVWDNLWRLLMPPFGVSIVALTLSWNTIPIELYPGMDTVLQIGTVLFQVLFTFLVMLVHDRSRFLTSVDIVIILISGFVDWFWFANGLWGSFEAGDLVFYSLLYFYMTFRAWFTAVRSGQQSWRKECTQGSSLVTLDKLDFVWVTRSASLVCHIVPTLAFLWDSLCEAWGEEAAKMVTSIQVFVTDQDPDACAILRSELRDSSLEGSVRFQRPDMQAVVERHSLDRISERRTMYSTTLLVFCGSASLSAVIGAAKTENDVSTVITGQSLHQMEFTSESYGPFKAREKPLYDPEETEGDATFNDDEHLMLKQTVKVEGGVCPA